MVEKNKRCKDITVSYIINVTKGKYYRYQNKIKQETNHDINSPKSWTVIRQRFSEIVNREQIDFDQKIKKNFFSNTLDIGDSNNIINLKIFST